MIHDWTRLWTRPDAEISLADGGFLVDPPKERDSPTRGFGWRFGEISDLRCLILLGEPGMGKTEVLQREASALLSAPQSTDDVVHQVDLGSTREESILERMIFGSAQFDEWASGTTQLHLFLDGLDEAGLRLGVVGEVILRGLQDVDRSRLRLRLTCRTADRLPGFESRLLDLGPEEETGVFELAPLRRVDVRRAAEDRGLDPEWFIDELFRRDIVPLAIKPVTLRMLLDLVEEEGELPRHQIELYRRGLEHLVGERGERRQRDPATRGQLQTGQRIAVAGRLAAAMVLSGRTRISLDEGGQPSHDIVTLAQLSGGSEVDRTVAVPAPFSVSEEELREVLNTGLFSARGHDLGWAHQTYAEFLTADYLAGGRIPKPQVISLLTVRGSGARRVVPQLRDLAGWAAARDDSLMEELLLLDPLILLRGDVALADETLKSRLAEALLDSRNAVELDRERFDARVRRNLSGLNHDGLTEIVRRRLIDRGAPEAVRRVACDLTRACSLSALAMDLLRIAQSESEPIELRVLAVRSLAALSDLGALSELVPLVERSLPEDENDELRGSILREICPSVLSAVDVLPLLTPQKRSNFFGAYVRFLSQELPAAFSDEQLPQALRWIRELSPASASDEFGHFAERLLIRGAQAVASDQVRSELAATILVLITDHIHLQTLRTREEADVFADANTRRAILGELVPAISRGELDPVVLVTSTPRLIKAADADWAIDGLRASIGSSDEAAWARLVYWADRFEDSDHESVMAARDVSGELHELTRYAYGPVELDSDLAAQMRQQHATEAEWEQERRRLASEAPDFDENLDFSLDQIDNGDVGAFWRLNRDLWGEPGNRWVEFGGNDITASPGWLRASEERRARIAAATMTYIMGYEPSDYWVDAAHGYLDAAAGYRALRYLAEHDPAGFASIGDSLCNWVMPVITYLHDASNRASIDDWLLERVAFQCPEAFFTAVEQRIEAEAERGDGYLSVLHRVKPFLEGTLGERLLERWRHWGLPRQPSGQLLRGLLDARVPDAASAGGDRVEQALAAGNMDDAKTLAVALLAGEPDAWATRLEPLVVEHPGWGGDVLQGLANDTDRSDRFVDFRLQLPDWELSYLFQWLSARFPVDEDPAHDDADWMGPRDQIARYRDELIRMLIASGTPDAPAAIAEAGIAVHRDFSWAVLQAEETLLRVSWTPPRPEDLVRIAMESDRRIVTSADDLQRVVLETLQGVQRILFEQANQLWDTTAGRPKSENEISAWIAARLDELLRGRAVIVNREVEIRPNPAGGVGDRSDIFVDAIAGTSVEGADRLTVVVEVKGCWHREVLTAMREQLSARYLSATRRHGIYLVVVFGANRWSDDSDRRRQQCQRLAEPLLLLDELSRQADGLRSQGLLLQASVLDATLH